MRLVHVAPWIGLVLLASASIVAEQTQAADPDPCRSHTVGQVVGTNTAGTFTLCLRNDANVERQGQAVQISATLTSNAALTGANPTVTLTINALAGCTAGTPVTSGTAAGVASGPSVSTTWLVTVTGERCTFYIRMTATSGAATVSDMALAGNVAINENWTTILTQFAWLIWIIAAVLVQTLLHAQPAIRVLIDLVLDAGILLLPMDGNIRFWIMAGGIILLVLDFLFLFIQLHKAAKGRRNNPGLRSRARRRST